MDGYTMDSFLSFESLLLLELIVLLVIALFFMFLYANQQRKLLKKFRDKYQEIKLSYEEKVHEYRSFYEGKNNNQIMGFADYLEQAIADSHARYEKFTQAKIPKIDPGQPFSAKVAALRYLCLSVEKEALESNGAGAVGWGFYEKKLVDIIRLFAKPKELKQVRNNRVRLLQERIDVLKPYEEENKRLLRSLERTKERQAQLEEHHKENQVTIKKLQKMLDLFRQPAGNTEPNVVLQHLISKNSRLSPDEYLTNGTKQLDVVAGVSNDSGRQFKYLIQELDNCSLDIPPEIKRKFETSIRALEIELMKSDTHIGDLKKQLKDAKTQATNYAIMLSEAKSVSGKNKKSAGDQDTYDDGILSQAADNHDQDELHITESETENVFSTHAPIAPMDYLDHEKVIGEIKKLRENNKIQRSIIVNLEGEIKLLKDSFLGSDSEDVRTEKQKEVSRLERIVKECEGCIETLESEVDDLYLQLQERLPGFPMANINEDTQNNDVELLNKQLEMLTSEMEQTVAQYRQTHSLNRFIYDFIRCTSVEDAAKKMVMLIKEFQAPIGFYIHSSAGKVDYFPAAIFNEHLKGLAKSSGFKEPVIYLNEGTVFSSEKVNLILLPSIDSKHRALEATLGGLTNIANEHIRHLEADKRHAKHTEGMGDWIKTTKNQLADLDIQYAYQVEENRKTFNHFISELRQAYHLLDLKGNGLIILDNAINEYEERMHVLLSSGDVIDREISSLITHMDNLQAA